MKQQAKIILLLLAIFWSNVIYGSIYSETKSGHKNGRSVYWVKIHNPTKAKIKCTVTATNGTKHSFKVKSNKSSGWKLITDSRAGFVFNCR